MTHRGARTGPAAGASGGTRLMRNRMSPARAAALVPTDMKAVTGVAAPW